MALEFNRKLSPALEVLKNKLPETKVVFIDVYDTLNDMIENPKNYGKYEYTCIYFAKKILFCNVACGRFKVWVLR